jgi:hypothetical protein
MATRGLLLALGPAAALGLGRFAYALVLPLMQAAWGLSYAEGGLLGSANTLGYLLGALLTGPLWGPWVERVGGKKRAFPRPPGALPGKPPALGPAPSAPKRPPLWPLLPGGDHRHHPGLPRRPSPKAPRGRPLCQQRLLALSGYLSTPEKPFQRPDLGTPCCETKVRALRSRKGPGTWPPGT